MYKKDLKVNRHVRLTEEQFQFLKDVSEKTGIKINDIIRNIITNFMMKSGGNK